jgi:adenylyltransferase/sulfurtransferase
VELTAGQRERYARSIAIASFGERGQQLLGVARVCVVGLGGLGSPAALYLAAAGIGTLTLVDDQRVETSNLQRQILHTTPGVGASKTASAERALGALNPDVTVKLVDRRIDEANAEELLGGHDAVVEATDSFEAKYLVNDACVALGMPLATAGVRDSTGHALFVVPGSSPCLRCVFPAPPGHGAPPSVGVLGAVAGVLGSTQALEVIRWIARWHTGDAAGTGRLHAVDGESLTLRTLTVRRDETCRCASAWKSE